jgi:hypothetical protein
MLLSRVEKEIKENASVWSPAARRSSPGKIISVGSTRRFLIGWCLACSKSKRGSPPSWSTKDAVETALAGAREEQRRVEEEKNEGIEEASLTG